LGPCTIAFFPPTTSDEDLERRCGEMHHALEKLPFTLALRPDGDGRARHHFCFRVPGKVIAVLEHLALGRGFGGNPGQVEMAFLQGIQLRPGHRADLQILLQSGTAALVRDQDGGRRRVTFLESGKGYTGVYEEVPLRDALRARVREGWRRFPVGIVMFVGLPFFIASFWVARWLGRPGARATPAHSESGGAPSTT
jgi:hypothetical protein